MSDRSKLLAEIIVLKGDVERYRERCTIKDAEIVRLRDINSTLDRVIADTAEVLGCKPDNEEILDRIDRMRSLLRDYRNKVPLGHQPHMIAQEVDMVIGNEQAAPEKSA